MNEELDECRAQLKAALEELVDAKTLIQSYQLGALPSGEML